jgi:hypothetical protein
MRNAGTKAATTLKKKGCVVANGDQGLWRRDQGIGVHHGVEEGCPELCQVKGSFGYKRRVGVVVERVVETNQSNVYGTTQQAHQRQPKVQLGSSMKIVKSKEKQYIGRLIKGTIFDFRFLRLVVQGRELVYQSNLLVEVLALHLVPAAAAGT